MIVIAWLLALPFAYFAAAQTIDSCVLDCITVAVTAAGCTTTANITCICTNPIFATSSATCVENNCGAADNSTARALFDTECGAIISSFSTHSTATATRASQTSSSAASNSSSSNGGGKSHPIGEIVGPVVAVVVVALIALLLVWYIRRRKDQGRPVGSTQGPVSPSMQEKMGYSYSPANMPYQNGVPQPEPMGMPNPHGAAWGVPVMQNNWSQSQPTSPPDAQYQFASQPPQVYPSDTQHGFIPHAQAMPPPEVQHQFVPQPPSPSVAQPTSLLFQPVEPHHSPGLSQEAPLPVASSYHPPPEYASPAIYNIPLPPSHLGSPPLSQASQLDDALAEFLAKNNDLISPELGSKLRMAHYLPNDNPGDLSADIWQNQYGVGLFELRRVQEAYKRSKSKSV